MKEGSKCMGFPRGSSGKESACQHRRLKRSWFDPWVGKIPWRREWQHTPLFLPGESHGQRSLAGPKESGMTERDSTHRVHDLNSMTFWKR